jgi:hypothetical protein
MIKPETRILLATAASQKTCGLSVAKLEPNNRYGNEPRAGARAPTIKYPGAVVSPLKIHPGPNHIKYIKNRKNPGQIGSL